MKISNIISSRIRSGLTIEDALCSLLRKNEDD